MVKRYDQHFNCSVTCRRRDLTNKRQEDEAEEEGRKGEEKGGEGRARVTTILRGGEGEISRTCVFFVLKT